MYKCKGCGKETPQAPNHNTCETCGCESSYVDTENRRVSKHTSDVVRKTAVGPDIISGGRLQNTQSKNRSCEGEVEDTLSDSPKGPERDRKGKSLEPHQSHYTRVLQWNGERYKEVEMSDKMLEEMIKKDVPEGTQPPLYVCITPKCFKLFTEWNDNRVK